MPATTASATSTTLAVAVVLLLMTLGGCFRSSGSIEDVVEVATDLQPVLDGSNSADVETLSCIPLCENRACGNDGCGGSCGDCPQNHQCDESGACVSRWVVEGGGVVTDLWTDRQWMRDEADQPGNWSYAMAYCEGLELAGRNDWRLPQIQELRSLILGCPGQEEGGACEAEDPDCLNTAECREDCNACPLLEGPGEDGCYRDPLIWLGDCYEEDSFNDSIYWSSSPSENPDAMWDVSFASAHVGDSVAASWAHLDYHVRCVRSDCMPMGCTPGTLTGETDLPEGLAAVGVTAEGANLWVVEVNGNGCGSFQSTLLTTLRFGLRVGIMTDGTFPSA